MKSSTNFSQKCVLYCRVSSKEQEDTGYSLDAQQHLLEQYADKNQIDVVKIFRISESASGKQIRKVFYEMLDYVKKNKIKLILSEKIDRLTRNLKDASVISEWIMSGENEVHFVKENFIVSRNTRAHENLVWDMKVAISRFYTNNLSEEVRKGQTEKASQGKYPGSFKLGYLSVGEKGKKEFVPNDKTFNQARKMLEMYASGNYSMKAIKEKAWEVGLRSRFDKRLYKSQIEKFLKDPFNYGCFLWKGELREGTHKPLIIKETYDIIQEVRTRGKAPFYQRHEYIFSKMIKCGECKGTISSEVQKGRVYCACKHNKVCTQKGGVREDRVEKRLIDVMSVFESITAEEAKEIQRRIKENHKKEAEYKLSVISTLNAQYTSLQVKIDRMYDDKLSGDISTEMWRTKNDTAIADQKKIQAELEKLKNQEAEYFETYIDILDLAQRAKSIYNKRKSSGDKRLLLQNLFSEIIIKDGSVKYELKTPVRKYRDRVLSFENNFELKKAFADNAKAYSEAKITSMLPR